MIFNPKYSITPEISTLLEQIDKYKDSFKRQFLNSQLQPSLRESARLASTYYSMKIAGNSLSIDEVEIIIKKRASNSNRSRNKEEILNYFQALKFIDKNPNIGFTEKLIKSMHGLLLYAEFKPSNYRNSQHVIRDQASADIIYIPPEAPDVPILMKSLVEWTNKELQNRLIPIPILAFVVHYQIVTIHPYKEGNGRLARLLTTLLLRRNSYGLQGTYSLEEFFAKNSQDYYAVLAVDGIFNYKIGRAEADITNFISFMLKALLNAFTKASLYFSKPKVKAKVNKKISELRVLNRHQRAILSLFTDYQEVTSRDIANHLGIKTRNATYLIRKWLKEDFIEIGNPAYKSRTYILNNFWEDFIT